MEIPLVPKEEVLTSEFEKDNIKIKVEYKKDYFDIRIDGPINIFIDTCMEDDKISSGLTLSLPQELFDDISNILGKEIEKDGEINKLVLYENIAILDFIPTIDETDKLKINETTVSIGSKRKRCEEILISGNVESFISFIFHPYIKTSANFYIPTELIKFIGNSLGIETEKVIILDENIKLKSTHSRY